jgi:hypothetical protein
MLKKYIFACIVVFVITWGADKFFPVQPLIRFHHIWLAFSLAFILGFIILYFGHYRSELAEIRKENELEEKYKKLYDKFIKLQ